MIPKSLCQVVFLRYLEYFLIGYFIEICTSLAAQPNGGYHPGDRIRNDFPEVAEKYEKDKILLYRDLKKDITTWKIEEDSDSDTAVFWKWVFVHYQDKIVEYHSKTCTVFPSDSTPGKLILK